jgi:hypothetical protein
MNTRVFNVISVLGIAINLASPLLAQGRTDTINLAYHELRGKNRSNGVISVPELTGAVSFSALCNMESDVCVKFKKRLSEINHGTTIPRCADIARLAHVSSIDLVGYKDAGGIFLNFTDYSAGIRINYMATPSMNDFDINTNSMTFHFHDMSGRNADPDKEYETVVINRMDTDDNNEVVYFREGKNLKWKIVERRGSSGKYNLKFENLKAMQSEFCMGNISVNGDSYNIDGEEYNTKDLEQLLIRAVENTKKEKILELFDGTSISNCDIAPSVYEKLSSGEAMRLLLLIENLQRKYFSGYVMGPIGRCSIGDLGVVNFSFRGVKNIITTYFPRSDFYSASEVYFNSQGLLETRGSRCYDERIGRHLQGDDTFCGRDSMSIIFGE